MADTRKSSATGNTSAEQPQATSVVAPPNVGQVAYRIAYELAPMLAALQFMGDAARVLTAIEEHDRWEAISPPKGPRVDSIMRGLVKGWRSPLGDEGSKPLDVITDLARVTADVCRSIAQDAEALDTAA